MAIQVYGFWRSIASFRVRVALRLKGLPFEEIPVNILTGEQFKPGGYETINAERVVPTFIHDGHSIEWVEPTGREGAPDDRLRETHHLSKAMGIASLHPSYVPTSLTNPAQAP